MSAEDGAFAVLLGCVCAAAQATDATDSTDAEPLPELPVEAEQVDETVAEPDVLRAVEDALAALSSPQNTPQPGWSEAQNSAAASAAATLSQSQEVPQGQSVAVVSSFDAQASRSGAGASRVPAQQGGEEGLVFGAGVEGDAEPMVEPVIAAPEPRAAPAAWEALREAGGARHVGSSELPMRDNPDAPQEAQLVVHDAQGDARSGLAMARASADVEAATHAADGAEPGPALERATLETLAEHTIRGVRYLVTRNEKVLTVRLVPASLGELHLEVTSADDVLHVRLTSGSPLVREALNVALEQLRASLTREGFEVGRVVVSEGTGPQFGFADTPNRPTTDPGSVVQPDPGLPASEPAQANAALARPGPAPHDGVLNVFV